MENLIKCCELCWARKHSQSLILRGGLRHSDAKRGKKPAACAKRYKKKKMRTAVTKCGKDVWWRRTKRIWLLVFRMCQKVFNRRFRVDAKWKIVFTCIESSSFQVIGHLHNRVILLLTARILFVFPFIFKFGNPSEV